MQAPKNIDAEEALICCCLMDNSVYDSISATVQAKDFYSYGNAIIFEAIAELANKGAGFSEIELFELLQRQGIAENAGGISNIMRIQKKVDTPMQVQNYAEIIREKSRLRKIIRASKQCMESAEEDQDADEIIAEMEKQLTDLMHNGADQDCSISSAAQSLAEDFKKMQDGTYVTNSMPTYIQQLDEKLSAGGISNGEVMVVAAPTSCGKTCIALNIALQNGVTQGKPGLYFSFEMQSKSLAKRMIQTCAAVNLDRFRDGVLPPEKQKHVWEATEKVQASKIYTEHYVRNVEELRSKARMHKRKHFIEWIVIDYLQLVPWDSRMKKHDAIAEISHQIKLMAMELDLPIILLAQVNREGAKRETGLTLHDLKDSGDIENDADIILLLWPNGEDTNAARMHDKQNGSYISIKYNVAKQREGERDQYGKFIFKNHIGRFK
jgi:replicative DNA helicase